MAKTDLAITGFGGGEVGAEIQGRVNLEGYAATASVLENFMPDTAGNLHFRPGMGFQTTGPAAGTGGRIEPFFLTPTQKHLLWFSANELRFVQSGGTIITAAVSSTITNGVFAAGLAGWTDISSGGSTATGGTSGLVLVGDGSNVAGVRQQVPTASSGTQHSLRIRVTRGPVTFRCGSTAGADDYFGTASLRQGEYILSFTPSGAYWVEFTSPLERQIIVQDIAVQGAGDLALSTPWSAAEIWKLRLEPSLNVVYVADGVRPKRRIERYGASSWGLAVAQEADGPFQLPNTDDTFSITPSVRTGNGTLTASRSLFKSTHVGALFQLTHSGQFESRTLSGADQWSSPIEVTGTSTGRTIYWTVTGTFTATVRLQRSIGNTTSWENVASGTGTYTTTAAGSFSYRDGEDNVTIYFRCGIATGDYTSGTPVVTLSFPFGSTVGVARVTGYTSSTVVDMEVLSDFANTTATSEWSEGAWSDYRGHPKAISIFSGRLWNGRDDQFWGSGSDLYESQAGGEDDADAISGTLSVGAAAPQIIWLLSLGRLLVGTSVSVADVSPIKTGAGLITIAASALDEALTPANTNARSQDSTGVYIDQSGHTASELSWSAEASDYAPRSLMRLHKDIGRPGIVQLAFSSRPDPRLYMVRSDGQCLVKLFDRGENVMGWSRIITDGLVKSVAVLPGSSEDDVYFLVDRNADASPWHLEKMAPLYRTTATDACHLDAYVKYTGSPVTNISGATHLNGKTVKIWGDGALLGERTIVAGAFSSPLSNAKGTIVAGLSYTGRYRSSKLAIGAQAGSALGQRGKPVNAAFLLLNSVRSLRYGADFVTMDTLTDRDGDVSFDSGPGLTTTTTDWLPIPGDYNRDPHVAIEVEAPHPVTVQAVAVAMNLSEKVRA